jgi:hypothetical protein
VGSNMEDTCDAWQVVFHQKKIKAGVKEKKPKELCKISHCI